MYYLATTRFNTDTWRQNNEWRERKEWKGCVYGTPVRIADKYTPDAHMFVLEMHNDKNKIQGIGLVKNKNHIGKYHKIYEDGNYNRYIYKSTKRIDRSELDREQKKTIRILDILLFKGSRHLKRGHGILVVPQWISANKHILFISFFKKIFNLEKPK
jgi:hypothetical protein